MIGIEAQMVEVTFELSTSEEVEASEVTIEKVVAPEVVVGTQMRVPELTSKEIVGARLVIRGNGGTQVHAPMLLSEEMVGIQI